MTFFCTDASNKCSYGTEFGENCSDPATFVLYNSLPNIEILSLNWSSGVWFLPEDATICQDHYEKLVGYTQPKATPKHKKCCAPFEKHTKNITSGIRQLTILAALKYQQKGLQLAAGDWLCPNCRTRADKLEAPEVKPASQSSEEHASDKSSGKFSQGLSLTPEVIKAQCADNLKALNLSPLDLKNIRSKIGRVSYGKRKISQVEDLIRKRVCVALDITEDDLGSEEMDKTTLAEEMEDLLEEIQKRLPNIKNTKEKIALLTLSPLRWSPTYAANFFGVSRHIISKAQAIRINEGILNSPTYKRGWQISEETKNLVVLFYCQDDNSRLMPGKTQCVSLGNMQHAQKRLVLHNLRDMYTAFLKEYNYEIKIGFSMFCSLKPKYCVLAGSSGTHNVCVCTKHQNCKLKLKALGICDRLKDIMEEIVCSSDNRSCMLGLCQKCNNIETIVQLITTKVKRVWADELNPEDCEFLSSTVEYCEWVSTDRDELITRTCKVTELIDILAENMRVVIPHHFTSREQADFLKKEKENLKPNKAIVVMDFNMNYSCLIQDASQGNHWNKNAATVHPVVIYYRDANNEATVHKSLCTISDDVLHDVSHVKKIQDKTMQYIKQNLPEVTEVMYMTDGCAQQYKNCQSFLNLCKHEETHGIKATWCFFATSHGKSACDGIGGTVKREATKASIRRPYKDQILNAKKLYEFCIEHLSKEITYIWISKQELDFEREANRPKARTIPGTRSFHHFYPLSGKIVADCSKFLKYEAITLPFIHSIF